MAFRDTGQKRKGIRDIFVYGILGSILGIWGYTAFLIFGTFAIFILGIWDIFSK